MLQFSFSTVLMALLASNMIAILIAIAFLNKDFLLCVGYKSVPIIWSAREPCIILPNAIDIPPEKLHYILYHEALHYFRHDLFVKKAIHFLAIVYWWNPACVILHKHSSLLLEMYVDRAITNRDPNIIQEYTECLLFMKKKAEYISSQISNSPEESVCPLIHPHSNDLGKRAVMLIKKPITYQKVGANILLATVIICVLAWSHLFILETSYLSSLDGHIILNPLAESTYFIMDEFSNYKVYIDGIYIETVTSLEFYPHGIKIYNEEGVLIDEN